MEEYGHLGHPPRTTQMMGRDLQMGLKILDMVQEELQCLLMAMEEDTSQRETARMTTVWQLVRALENDYIKLKSNLYLLQYQALTARSQEMEAHQPDYLFDHPFTTAVGPPPQPGLKGD